MGPVASVSMDPVAASNSIDNSDTVLMDKDDKDAHDATNVPPSVSDYVDGKVCLICDIEFLSPIIAINHAKTNHLDIINLVSLHIHSKLLYLSPDMSYFYDFPLFSLAKGSNSLCFDHKFPLEHQIIEINRIFTLETCSNSVDHLQSGINNAQISLASF